jgi:hypothetical protein
MAFQLLNPQAVRTSSSSSRASVLPLIAIFVAIGLSAPLAAYVDLGSGSYIFQVAISSLFALMFLAKNLFARLLGKLKRPTRGGDD